MNTGGFVTMQGHSVQGVSMPEGRHFVSGKALSGPYPGFKRALFHAHDFCTAEQAFLSRGSYEMTAAGFCGGDWDEGRPSYQTVTRAATTLHREAVQVVFPTSLPYAKVLYTFWTCHNPRIEPPMGKARRKQASTVFAYGERQREQAAFSKEYVERQLRTKLATQVLDGSDVTFFHAEEHYQQYAARHGGVRVAKGVQEMRHLLRQKAFLEAMRTEFGDDEEAILPEEEAL